MPGSKTDLFSTPERTAVETVQPAALDSPVLQELWALWQMQRGGRAMPVRDDLVPHGIARHLRYVSLVRVLAEPRDYELRIVGDAHVQAYGVSHQGRRLSELDALSPKFARRLAGLFDGVVETGAAFAQRGYIGRDVGQSRIVSLEAIYLPLGARAVDHILLATVYAPRDGYWAAATRPA